MKPLTATFLLIFFLLITTTTPFPSNASFPNCTNTFSCGTLKNIGYPFTGAQRPSYCGLPGFHLTCLDDKATTVLKVDSLSYIVTELDQTNHSLHLTRSDLNDTVCTNQFTNTSLDSTFFALTADHEMLTLFYGCNAVVSEQSYPLINSFSCDMNGSSSEGFYFIGLDPNDPVLGGIRCDVATNVPISRSWFYYLGPDSNRSEDVLGDILRFGFAVDYSDPYNDDCATCRKSDGECGFDAELGKSICICGDRLCSGESSKTSLGIGLSIAGAAIVGIGIGCMYLYAKRLTIGRKNKNHKQIEAIIKNSDSLTPKRYSYSGIKKMTNSFKEKLGEGAFGSVYKGKLQEGDVVAVNFLSESKGDGEDFINEVASFSRTSHINIIRLLGFCYEGRKRALIYEYMYNGSLDKFIYDQRSSPHKNHLKWDKLYEIATGIARGLEYLHRGCATRIVHFDIKPHNILLDENFCPKISDFGLAKLSKTRESRVSMLHARGTIGYIAPEVYCRSIGEVSYRADVYSYGMMVLEIIGARKNINAGATETYFPDWIYEHIESVGVSKLHDIAAGTNVEDDDDQRISRMMIVGLWCIQMSPADRPSMTKVVEMLEGSLESLQVPPKPVSCSSVVRLSSPYSSTTTSQITAIIPLQHEETN